MHTPDPTDLMSRLRAARPEPDATLLSPELPAAQALVDEIVTKESTGLTAPRPVPSPDRRHRPHARVALIASAAVVAAAVGLGVVTRTGDDPRASASHASTTRPAPTSPAPIALVNIRTIAARSGTALSGTGRAEISFADQEGLSAGTSDLTFSGHNDEMVIHFAGTQGRPGFDAQNRTVDGQFYLNTPGPDNIARWYHETGQTGTSVFDTDPRTLLNVLAPEAGFVPVGSGTVDGVAVTHLRATKLDALPSLDLSLGPIDGRSVTALDLWVGADDVVRRVDLTSERKVQEIDPSVAPTLSKSKDGTVTFNFKDGHKVSVPQGGNTETVTKDLPKVTRTFRSSYSARFFDIGAPITITAPPNATDLAAKG